MRHAFAALKGGLWGSILLAHLCVFAACLSTIYLAAPNLSKAVGAIARAAAGKAPAIDLSEIADQEEIQRQVTSVKETGKPKPSAVLWITMAWSLLISVALGSGILIIVWWRVKGRGIVRYLISLVFLGPFSGGALIFAKNLIEALPENKQPFPPTLAGVYEFNQATLGSFLQIPIILFFVLLPAWIYFAKSRNLNFASLFFPRQK